MKRKIILAIAAIIASLSAASAQTTEETFQRHNRWMVGGEFVRNILHANGGGVTGIYGRQFSEIVFLGVGFGVDTYIYKAGKSTTTITDADGTQTVIIRPPYRYSFLVPVYADLQVNFSRSRSPFFGELKVGGAVQVDLKRIRGTHNTNELELQGGGVLMGAAAGKRQPLLHRLVGADLRRHAPSRVRRQILLQRHAL